MANVLACPQGHCWSAPGGTPLESMVCPVCGMECASDSSSNPATILEKQNVKIAEGPFATGLPGSSAGAPHNRFTIMQAHARGGLGQVSLARDEDFGREVALKEIRPDRAGDPSTRERFLNEARTTGQLEHPGIVPAYALGHNAAGEPFYAMKFVRGKTLAEAIKEYHRRPTPLGFRELLRRFGDVCQAVAYAHSKGVIHRDLKPINVMLGDFGETLVLDWGLAKRLDDGVAPQAEILPRQDLSSTSIEAGAQQTTDYRPQVHGSDLTQVGHVLGTPSYMSPEQAEGRSHEAGPPADCYSLGAILFEIVSDRPPYQGRTGQEILTQVRAGPPPTLAEVTPGVPRPLQAICHKAMARRPEDRYASVLELAQEIERWLAYEPVVAYREHWGDRLARWRRRYPAAATGLTALLVTAVLALVVGIVLIKREQRQTDQARNEAVEQEGLAKQREREARLNLYAAQIYLAFEAWEKVNVSRVLELLAAQRLKPGQEDHRGFEWYHLWHRCNAVPTFRGKNSVHAVAFTPDGKFLATAGPASLSILNTKSWRERHFRNGCQDLAISPDGKTLAAMHKADAQWQVVLLDPLTGRTQGQIPSGPAPPGTYTSKALDFSPDGKLLALRNPEGGLQLWDLLEKRPKYALPGTEGWGCYFVAFAGDRRSLAAGLAPRNREPGSTLPGGVAIELRVWDLVENRLRFSSQVTHSGFAAAAFAPDGKTLAAACNDLSIKLLDSTTGATRAALAGPRNYPFGLAYSPDGKWLAAGYGDGGVRVWDSGSDQIWREFKGHSAPVGAVAFAPDSKSLVSGSQDGTAKVWDLTDRQAREDVLASPGGNVGALAFSPDSTMLACGRNSGLIWLWDLTSTPPKAQELVGHKSRVWSLAFTPDGRSLISGSRDGTLRVWSVSGNSSSQPTVVEGQHGEILSVAVAPDGQTLASAGDDQRVRLWDLTRQQPTVRAVLEGHSERVTAVAFSPSGDRLASANLGGQSAIHLWDASTGRRLSQLKLQSNQPKSLAFSADGNTLLATGGKPNAPGVIITWDLTTGRHRLTRAGHTNSIWGACLSPDSRTMASAGDDGSIGLWHVATGMELGNITAHRGSGAVKAVAFSPDGKTLASGALDGIIRLWRTSEDTAGAPGHVPSK